MTDKSLEITRTWICSRAQRSSLVLALALMILLAITAAASDAPPGFADKHQAGVRLGVWGNLGDSPPDSGGISVNGQPARGQFVTNIGGASFALEGFFGYRLSRQLMLDISAGTVNRGSATLSDSVQSDVGNLMLYPITLQTRVYPARVPLLGVYPYVSAGVGLYIGRRSVQFTTAWYSSYWEEETEVAFSYVAAAGFDWPVASTIGLEAQVKYLPIEFSKTLLTINDYSAISVTIGVKYLYK